MKKRIVLTGIISLLLVFGVISCKDPTSTTTYTATYTVGRGGGDAPAKQTVDEGTAITLPNQGGMTAPSGEIFDGWKDGGGTAYAAGASHTVNANVTFTAQWKTSSAGGTQYTVTYSAGNGGGSAPAGQTVTAGTAITLPNQGSMTAPSGETFDGWKDGGGTAYTAGASYTVNANVTFTAQWTTSGPVTIPATTVAGALLWLDSHVADQTEYIIELAGNESIDPETIYYPGKTVTITLRGGSSERTVSLNSVGSLFTVRSGVTLVLDSNITLRGISGITKNTTSLVSVSGGTLVMNDGSKITGNTNRSSSTSSPSYGGGVYVGNGVFTMTGGIISDNTVDCVYAAYGGGVYVDNGTFTMSGGIISNNEASSQSSSGGGVNSNGTFTMSGGTISNNRAHAAYSASGGGVSAIFTMTGGTISGNTASSTTSGNSDGGGVRGNLIKTGDSSITGNSAANGAVAYVSSSQKRETAAGPGVNLDSSVPGSSGGWE
ncbi:hypothetical protein FACS1894141_6410 [Spirochaetia bacterium]|nr:hypothetical protein FACS1894141_6410 [Spirochaetia bacterium]